jgi:hypothetical protein
MGLNWRSLFPGVFLSQLPLPVTSPSLSYDSRERSESLLYKTKNRIINFRVSDEELDRLKVASNLHGARCLSEFARAVILGTAAGSSPATGSEGCDDGKIQTLDSRLAAVESDLARVINILSSAGEVCRQSED